MSLYDRVNEFVEIYLRSQTDGEKEKFIHDPIWGGIEVHPWEQSLVDTPLFQRLRQIHQTGCVFATYPSAKHTRFEHTLGVAHLAGKMIERLRKRGDWNGEIDFDKSYQAVRFAALTHDLGHSAFSHTTEEIYKHCDDIRELTEKGGKYEDKGAGELLSFLIVTSQAFRRFFADLRKKDDRLKVDVNDFAPLILGRPSEATPENIFEANVISAPFDADKLDYFPRDGRAAGLEVSLDVDRLLNCIEIHEHKGDNGILNGRKLIVHRGGFNPLQQLLFARATLFSSVYHHHKVRACDCMIKGAIECFTDRNTRFNKSEVLEREIDLKSAADFLYLTDLSFFSEASRHSVTQLEHQLIHDLLFRRLLKRTITISTFTIDWAATEAHAPKTGEEEPTPCGTCGAIPHGSAIDIADHPKARAVYDNFYNLRSNPALLRFHAKEIYAQARIDCTEYRVWFDLPSTPSFKKAGDALIRTSPSGAPTVVEPLVKFIPIEKWVQTYEQYYAQGFLFGPPSQEQRTKLALIAREYLKEKFHLYLKDDCIAEDIRQAVASQV